MRFDKLDLNLLVALDALIEHKSVSIVAKKLYLTQPAISGALNRLREYFGDELFVQCGRQMILTPKAEELAQPIRQALTFIRSKITTPSQFRPAEAQRNFSIAASDYALNILVTDMLIKVSQEAPQVTFTIMSPDRFAFERLERGQVDVMITLEKYLLPQHPHMFLLEDDFVVICWSESSYRDGIDAKQFLAARHAVACFGIDALPAFSESYFSEQGIERRVDVIVPNFSALPYALIGTERIAIMHRMHAEYFARFIPISILPLPYPIPKSLEQAQWHAMRSSDEGIQWILRVLREQAMQVAKKLRPESGPLPGSMSMPPVLEMTHSTSLS
ncbi:LysR family transcriptional regulator [Beijerinckia mobilis]|uniref:LysR family transcriptional regulator n=1 Tax=Beijerinckia mobilis TaxID=231434 RepID=UPI00068E05A9|nr:LysR family transcriptional regulator [Beijerinckia mobilis]